MFYLLNPDTGESAGPYETEREVEIIQRAFGRQGWYLLDSYGDEERTEK